MLTPDEHSAGLSTSSRLASTHAALQLPSLSLSSPHCVVGTDDLCQPSIEQALSSEASTIVAFGRSNHMRWRRYVAQALQDSVFLPLEDNHLDVCAWEHGVCRLRVQRRHESSGRWSPLTVWFAPDPAAWHLSSALTTAIGLAHRAPFALIESIRRRDAEHMLSLSVVPPQRLHKDDRLGSLRGHPFRVVNIAIRAPHEHQKRFVLAGGAVTHNSSGHIGLTDFGLAVQLEEKYHYVMKGNAGTAGYLAPEVWAGEYYGVSADVWVSTFSRRLPITQQMFCCCRSPICPPRLTCSLPLVCLCGLFALCSPSASRCTNCCMVAALTVAGIRRKTSSRSSSQAKHTSTQTKQPVDSMPARVSMEVDSWCVFFILILVFVSVVFVAGSVF
jgi:hypothetical protein